MDDEKWISWEVQTAKRWSDIEDVLKLVNVDFIDYDHRMLVEYAFKLNHIIDKAEIEFSLAFIGETKALLEDLYQYAKEHFTREENFMDLFALPNRPQHKREHTRILNMLEEQLDYFNSGKIKLTGRLRTQVMDWLIKHINGTDNQFFDISNWSYNIVKASDWNDVKAIISLTGIQEIDNQHQLVTETALKTLKNITNNPSDEIIEEECRKLTVNAAVHFDFEKEFMERWNIEGAENHLEQHAAYQEKIAQFSVELKKDPGQLEEMKKWILVWWIKHINYIDKEDFAYRNWVYQLIECAQKVEDVLEVLRKTGIEKVDNDHIALMSKTFDLYSLIQKSEQVTGEGAERDNLKKQVTAALDQTYELAAAHFTMEESLMELREMNDLRSHRAEHKEILKKISSMRENYVKSRLYLSANLKIMLLEWWIEHTNSTDYRTFVQNWKGGLID